MVTLQYKRNRVYKNLVYKNVVYKNLIYKNHIRSSSFFFFWRYQEYSNVTWSMAQNLEILYWLSGNTTTHMAENRDNDRKRK